MAPGESGMGRESVRPLATIHSVRRGKRKAHSWAGSQIAQKLGSVLANGDFLCMTLAVSWAAA
jgi:hypothetical protein